MDYYDHAVAYLTERPGEIEKAWVKCGSHVAGGLFSFVTPSRNDLPLRPDGALCGCLTQIRSTGGVAWTHELTVAIRSDGALPDGLHRISVGDLQNIARWQRTIDAELNREPPVWVEPQVVNG
jgi:hypothetical protein